MKKHFSEKSFNIINIIFISFLTALCILPLIHILALSFSASQFADTGQVGLWPKGFTLDAYDYVANKPEFIKALGVSLKRVAIGLPVSLGLTTLAAYPLSKSKEQFKARNIYAGIILFSMIFGGGLIPTYLVVKGTGLLDTIWALVLPGAVQAWYIILLHNFFKRLPTSLEEAAYLDGAGPFKVFYTIMLPLSKAVLATITLFITVDHWNQWFDGIIYMNRPGNFPLQSYLRGVVVQIDYNLVTSEEIQMLENISQKNTKAAQIFVALVPILAVYPFMQKHFAKGIVLGSVKG